ncbi:MAG: Gfo/Idh/MocA family oxidoreductase [Geminicoccaceae bacterium]|nr:Gfo/Idh/MocA family oxidoreductase [Geminicoccaceae bacterium]
MPSTARDRRTPVRLAIVGAGTIGRVHLERMRASDDVEIVGIVDPSPATARIADEFATTCCSSIASLMADQRPDGVIVATPTEHHLAPVLELLDAGAHVLVEKPIAATVDEAEQMIARAEANRRQVLVGHHRRYYPLLRKTREWIACGNIGRLIALHAHWTLKKPDSYFAADWRKKRAAGPVLTNLIHEMDTLRFICGEIRSISAELSDRVHNFEKEDAAALVLTFESGAIGTVLISDGTPAPWAWELATGENPDFPAVGENTHRFSGTRASLEFPNLVLWKHGGAGLGWHDIMEREVLPCEKADPYARQIAHFCAVVRGEEEPLVPARDAARTLAAVAAVFDAARSGTRILV